MRPLLAFGAAALVLAAAVRVETRSAPREIEVADGIYLYITAPYGDVGLDGNAVAIVSSAGVLVFDTNGTPAASALVLDAIRRHTSQPVRFVVNSHWHWDHWYGTEAYAQAFPAAEVIAHEQTRAMMAGPALAFNQPGLDRDLPRYIAGLEARAAQHPELRATLDEDRFFLEQKRSVRHVLPNVTYTDQLTLHMGGREIQLRHPDRAVTPGDTFLYLPQEKIVVSGDLLVNPISFALSCYPTGWLRTLEQIDGLDASIIVPGHGEPLRDKALLHATMEVMRALLREGKAARARGRTPDEAKTEILPSLAALKTTITHGDQALGRAFDVQLVDWYLHRVYDELDGPLTDAIAPIPKS